MDKNVEELKKNIIAAFPLLASDKFFKITSPETPDYNCIAWAYNIKGQWMWPTPDATEKLDGTCFWPDGVIKTPDVLAFIEAFKKKGYEICTNADFEKTYQKIALYVQPGTTKCTHAARQLMSNGFWTSKLGKGNDIQHSTPYTIEGRIYGEVFCIMKRRFS